MGRKRVPDAERKARGLPPLPPRNVLLAPGEPTMPAHLSGAGADMWHWAADVMRDRGTLGLCSSASLRALAEVAQIEADAREAVAKAGYVVRRTLKNGRVVERISAEAQVLRQAARMLKGWLKACALTPRTARRIQNP